MPKPKVCRLRTSKLVGGWSMCYQLPWPAIKACEGGLLHAGGAYRVGRTWWPATQLVVRVVVWRFAAPNNFVTWYKLQLRDCACYWEIVFLGNFTQFIDPYAFLIPGIFCYQFDRPVPSSSEQCDAMWLLESVVMSLWRRGSDDLLHLTTSVAQFFCISTTWRWEWDERQLWKAWRDFSAVTLHSPPTRCYCCFSVFLSLICCVWLHVVGQPVNFTAYMHYVTLRIPRRIVFSAVIWFE